MEKIPTIFERDWEGDRSRVLDVVHSGCEWVIEGFGVPTRKYDGTCVMYDGAWWARRDVKDGKEIPSGFVALGYDAETEKTFGWEPIENSPFAKFHAEAVAHMDDLALDGFPWGGTYELLGPKVQGNPEGFEEHTLQFHSLAEEVICQKRDYESIKTVLETHKIEGIVFHNPDGRMAKIKARDFGIKR